MTKKKKSLFPDLDDDKAHAFIDGLSESLVSELEESVKQFRERAQAAGVDMPASIDKHLDRLFFLALHRGAALVAKRAKAPFLTQVTTAACCGAELLDMSQGDESLHQMLHKICEDFPNGDLSEGKFVHAHHHHIEGAGAPSPAIQTIIEAVEKALGAEIASAVRVVGVGMGSPTKDGKGSKDLN